MTTHPGNSTEAENGAVWAAILAAAIGCFSMGVLIDLAEASKAISSALNLYNPTGDLSGKSTLGVLIWLIAWGLLHARWKRTNITSPVIILAITIVLLLAALLAVFPLFFGLFAAS